MISKSPEAHAVVKELKFLKSHRFEINFEIFRHNQGIMLTLTGKLKKNNLEIFAFDNFGNEIFLTNQEQISAENLILSNFS